MCKYDVFFSYNSSDRIQAESLAKELQRRHVRVFLDRWYLIPGRPWIESLEESLAQCHSVAVLIGSHGLGAWQQRERSVALNRQAQMAEFRVIPVLLPGADPALGFLGLNTWIDFRFRMDHKALDFFAKSVRGQPGERLAIERCHFDPTDVCPYRGLRPFREEDSPLFFGREVFTKRLAEAVERQSFLAVVGASGSGKSSVVRAGLLPRLREDRGTSWEIAIMFPGKRPMHMLAAALLPLLQAEMTETDRLAEIGKMGGFLGDGTFKISDVVLRLLNLQPGTDRLLLIVDQWEELYSQADRLEREKFIDQLLLSISESPLTVVLTLRADFLGFALDHRNFVDCLRNGVIQIGTMTRDERREAIEGPLREVELRAERGLTDHLLDDVGEGPGRLPLLQFALLRLWQNRTNDTLSYQSYKAIGRIQGSLGDHAERVYSSFSVDEQTIAREILVACTQPGDGTEDIRRRIQKADLFNDSINRDASTRVLKRLIDERLLMASHYPGSRRGEEVNDWIELIHEALIRWWPRFRSWLEDDRDARRIRRRLEIDLVEWKRRNRDPSLLYSGGRLSQAEEWIQQYGGSHPELSDFVRRGILARNRELLKKRRLIQILSTVCLVAAILVIATTFQWRKAKRLSQIADSRALAEQALNNLENGRPVSALKLATDACGVFPSYQAERSLRRTLEIPIPSSNLMHDGNIFDAVWSHDGKYLVTSDGRINVWDSKTLTKRLTIEDQAGRRFDDLLVSSDGNYIVSGEAETTAVRIWDIRSGKEIAALDGHVGSQSLFYSPSEKKIVTRCSKGHLRLWDWENDNVQVIGIPEEIPATFGLTPDEKSLIVAVDGHEILLVDVDSGATKPFGVAESDKRSYVVSKDGSRIAGLIENEITVWDVEGKERVASIEIPNLGFVEIQPDFGAVLTDAYLFFSHKNSMALATGDDVVWLWYIAGRESRPVVISHMTKEFGIYTPPRAKQLVFGRKPGRARFSANNKIVCVPLSDGTVRVFDTKTGAQIALLQLDEFIVEAYPDAAGNRVLTRGPCFLRPCKNAYVWNIEEPAQQEKYSFGANGPQEILPFLQRNYVKPFSDDGRIAVVLDAMNPMYFEIYFVDIASGEIIARYNDYQKRGVARLAALSSDGKFFLTTSRDYKGIFNDDDRHFVTNLLIRERSSGGVVAEIAGPRGEINGAGVYFAVFSFNGQNLITCSGEGIQLWSVREERELFSRACDSGSCEAQFSRDDSMFFVIDGNAIDIFSVDSEKFISRLSHPAEVRSAQFTSRGSQILSWDSDGFARIWEIRDGKIAVNLEWENDVSYARLSRDDSLVAMIGDGGQLGVWRRESGKIIKTFEDASACCYAEFSPHGERLVTASRENVVKLWDTLSGEIIDIFRGHNDDTRWIQFSEDGKYISTADSLGRIRVYYATLEPLLKEARSRLATYASIGNQDK